MAEPEKDSVGNVKGDQYIPGPRTRRHHGDSFATVPPKEQEKPKEEPKPELTHIDVSGSQA